MTSPIWSRCTGNSIATSPDCSFGAARDRRVRANPYSRVAALRSAPEPIVPLAISTRALVAVAGIVAGAAFAAATPITPPPGAVVTTAHPQFNWTVPSNEQSDAIFIANKPDVTPEGKFYDENIVDGEVFTTAVNEWSPSSPLYAGRYWWNLWSHDVTTFANLYSARSTSASPSRSG